MSARCFKVVDDFAGVLIVDVESEPLPTSALDFGYERGSAGGSSRGSKDCVTRCESDTCEREAEAGGATGYEPSHGSGVSGAVGGRHFCG